MKILPFACAFLIVACSKQQAPPDLKTSNAWARETVPGQTSAAAYVTILNNGAGEDRLIGVTSDGAAHAMLHSTATDDGVARMRHIDHGLEIPAKAAVELTPGRTHIMLSGLKQPLRRGQDVPLTLKFEHSGNKAVTVKVVDAATSEFQEAR